MSTKSDIDQALEDMRRRAQAITPSDIQEAFVRAGRRVTENEGEQTSPAKVVIDPNDRLVISARRRIREAFGEDVVNETEPGVVEARSDDVVSTGQSIDPVPHLPVHRIALLGWVVTVSRDTVDQHSQDGMDHYWLHRALVGGGHFLRGLFNWVGGSR